MLFIRLLLVGTEGSHKEELYNQLYSQNTDIENQLCTDSYHGWSWDERLKTAVKRGTSLFVNAHLY